MSTFFTLSAAFIFLSAIITCILGKRNAADKIATLVYSTALSAFFLLTPMLLDMLNDDFRYTGFVIEYSDIFFVLIALATLVLPVLMLISLFTKSASFNSKSFIAYTAFSLTFSIALGINLFVSNRNFLWLTAFLLASLALNQILCCCALNPFSAKSYIAVYFVITGLFALAVGTSATLLLISAVNYGVYNTALLAIITILLVLGATGITTGCIKHKKLNKA